MAGIQTEYILFLDETDVNDSNKLFCLAGFIIPRKDYEQDLIPQINILKNDVLQSPHIVFHYTSMRKNLGDFKMLKDDTIRNTFWNNLYNCLKSLNITTIVSCINGRNYRKQFPREIALSEYNMLFNEIINSYVHFLNTNNGIGSIIIESRNPEQNRSTQNVFTRILNCGTNVYYPEIIRKRISTLGFNIKKDNCIGLQIADMIPLEFIRKFNQKNKKNNELYKILSSKLYKIHNEDTDTDISDGYGLIKIIK